MNKTSDIYIKIIEKRNNELSHKTFDCAKMIFLSWYNFFKRFLPITSKYMPSISII
jgi:hypothetical protein